jgi:cyclase
MIESRGPTFVRGHQDSTAVYGNYEAMLARGTSPFRPGQPLLAGERHGLELAAADGRAAFPGWRDARVVAPNVTVADRLTIHLGGRDAEVRFLGLGNTAGDVVVHVPDAKVVAAGDLVVAPIPYAYGSHVREWGETLARLKSLGATTIVPGHGAVQRDAAYVDRLSAALATLRDRAADAARRGLSLDSARATLRFDDLERQFEGSDPRLRGLLLVHFIGPGLPRAYRAP